MVVHFFPSPCHIGLPPLCMPIIGHTPCLKILTSNAVINKLIRNTLANTFNKHWTMFHVVEPMSTMLNQLSLQEPKCTGQEESMKCSPSNSLIYCLKFTSGSRAEKQMFKPPGDDTQAPRLTRIKRVWSSPWMVPKHICSQSNP